MRNALVVLLASCVLFQALAAATNTPPDATVSVDPSLAPTVTFNFEGVVDQVDEYIAGVLGGNVQAGDAFRGSFTFNTAALDERPSDPDWGEYQYDNLPDQFQWNVSIGSLSWTTAELDPWNFSSVIYVMNDWGSPPRDHYFVSTREVIGPSLFNAIELELLTFENLNALTSTDLPLSPPDIGLFETANRFFITGRGDFGPEYYIRGHLTTLLTTRGMLAQLATLVVAINIQQGISNSLDGKIDAALAALEDVNAHNDVAAVNSLNAFINAVEAQRGNKISDSEADALIASAQAIIESLTAR